MLSFIHFLGTSGLPVVLLINNLINGSTSASGSIASNDLMTANNEIKWLW
jgi:hypothetical protein